MELANCEYNFESLQIAEVGLSMFLEFIAVKPQIIQEDHPCKRTTFKD